MGSGPRDDVDRVISTDRVLTGGGGGRTSTDLDGPAAGAPEAGAHDARRRDLAGGV